MKASNDESNWVSPYLLRPLRSLEEVLAERNETRRGTTASIRSLSIKNKRPAPVATLLSLDEARMARRHVA